MAAIHPMPKLVSLCPARVVSLHDGDTSYFAFNMPFPGIEWAGDRGKGVRSRYAGINCPELATPEGVVAAQFTAAWLAAAANGGGYYPLLTQIVGIDNYGRPLPIIWNAHTGECINDLLLASGNAVVMNLAAQLVAP